MALLMVILVRALRFWPCFKSIWISISNLNESVHLTNSQMVVFGVWVWRGGEG